MIFLRWLQSNLDVMVELLPPSELRNQIIHFPSRYTPRILGDQLEKIRFDKCQEWLMSLSPTPACLSFSTTNTWKSSYSCAGVTGQRSLQRRCSLLGPGLLSQLPKLGQRLLASVCTGCTRETRDSMACSAICSNFWSRVRSGVR